MELKDLVGEHELTGVDMGVVPPCSEDWRYESSDTISFVLDGKAYMAVEDPSDGYRSSMRDLIELTEPVKNTFPPCRVVARYRSTRDEYGGSADVLELIDAVTGKTVLEVGTDNDDDYYPRFVGNFWPENMAVNKPVSADAVDPQAGSQR